MITSIDPTCQHCGKPLDRKSDQRKYCSNSCRMMACKARKIANWQRDPYRECDYCHEVFEAETAFAKICQACREAAEVEQKLQSRQGKPEPIYRCDGPPEPTAFLPGSWEKVEVLAQRLEAGRELWHELDGRTSSPGACKKTCLARILQEWC